MPTSLLEKVSMLVSSNLQSIVGQVHETRNPAHFLRHYVEVEEQLVNVEREIAQVDEKAESLRAKGLRCSEMRANLDKTIDGLLLQGRDKEALAAQQELNQLEQLDAVYRQQARQLDDLRQKLYRAQDTLKVRLSMMQEEREKLQEFVEAFRAQEKSRTRGVTYRVVDPEDPSAQAKKN